MGPKITFREGNTMAVVKFIKLNNGEELVASVEAKGDNLKITNPVKFMMTQEGLGMMPFFPLCKDDSFQLAADLVMLTADLDSEIYNAYQSRFGGIQIPTPGQMMKIITSDNE